MNDDRTVDYYDVLQVSSNAEPETIHRVYRLLAQRFHPDNHETGDDARFRAIQEA
jgi:curved DNA-binding protein CbpA